MRARRRDRKSFIDHGDPQGPAVAGEGLVHEKRGASLPAGDGFPVFAFVTAKTDPGPERLLTQMRSRDHFRVGCILFQARRAGPGVTETVAVTL